MTGSQLSHGGRPACHVQSPSTAILTQCGALLRNHRPQNGAMQMRAAKSLYDTISAYVPTDRAKALRFMGQYKGVAPVLRALKNHAASTFVVRPCVMLLGILVEDEKNLREIRQLGGLKLVTLVHKNHSGVPDIVHHLSHCYAAVRGVFIPLETIEEAQPRVDVEVILLCMLYHHDNADVAAAACRAFHEMAKDERAREQMRMYTAVPKLLTAACRIHSHHGRVQLPAMGAIAELCNDTDFARELGRFGAVEACLALLTFHDKFSFAIQQQTIWALTGLMKGDENNIRRCKVARGSFIINDLQRRAPVREGEAPVVKAASGLSRRQRAVLEARLDEGHSGYGDVDDEKDAGMPSKKTLFVPLRLRRINWDEWDVEDPEDVAIELGGFFADPEMEGGDAAQRALAAAGRGLATASNGGKPVVEAEDRNGLPQRRTLPSGRERAGGAFDRNVHEAKVLDKLSQPRQHNALKARLDPLPPDVAARAHNIAMGRDALKPGTTLYGMRNTPHTKGGIEELAEIGTRGSATARAPSFKYAVKSRFSIGTERVAPATARP